MDYSGWLFSDQVDMKVEKDLFMTKDHKPRTIDDWIKDFPGCWVKGSRQPFRGDWSDVKVYSNVYSPVGATVLDRCPNIEWVVVRGHAYNFVDLDYCRSRGIGVCSLGGFLPNCSSWITSHLGRPPFVFYGWGRIAREVAKGLNSDDVFVIRSSTERKVIESYLELAGTVIASVPVPQRKSPPLFNSSVFNHFNGCRFVSLCHGPLIDNDSLALALMSGKISFAAVDGLNMANRSMILSIPEEKLLWCRDRAWSTNFDFDDYKEHLKAGIKKMFSGDFDGILIPRGLPGEKPQSISGFF